MAPKSLQKSVSQKAEMARVLFYIFATIFSLTALFAFIALGIVFVSPDRPENFPEFNRMVWSLWSVVLAEVAAGILALWKNLFELSSEGEISTARNIVAEIIDGLESNGDITEDRADTLRIEYESLLEKVPDPVKAARSQIDRVSS